MSVSQRERLCGRVCVEHVDGLPEVIIKRSDGTACAHYTGLLNCGHVWTCPVCSLKKRGKRAENIAAAMRGVGGRWQMLTFTLRHREGMPLAKLRDALAHAYRRAKQGGLVQRTWSARVSMSVRACEITYGENGWHPHLHVLIRTTEWEPHEQAALLERWQQAIRGVLGPKCNPSDDRAIVWSAPFDASNPEKQAFYIFKLGGELTGPKDARADSLTHWDVARRAATDGGRWHWLWTEFQVATRGKRMLEMDERCADAAKRQLELEHANDDEPEGAVKTTRCELQRDDVRALRIVEHSHPGIFAWLLREAERHGAEGVAHWVQYARARCLQKSSSSSHPPNRWTGPFSFPAGVQSLPS